MTGGGPRGCWQGLSSWDQPFEMHTTSARRANMVDLTLPCTVPCQACDASPALTANLSQLDPATHTHTPFSTDGYTPPAFRTTQRGHRRSGHGGAAVRLGRRPRQCAPAAQPLRELLRVPGHPRQRDGGGLVPRLRQRHGQVLHQELPAHGRRRHRLGLHPRLHGGGATHVRHHDAGGLWAPVPGATGRAGMAVV